MTAPTYQAVQVVEEDRGRYLLDRERLLGPLMLAPAVIYIFALVGIPLVLAITYSLSDVTVGDQSIDWAGFENFRAVWRQDTFQTALRNSIMFTIISQVIVIVLANILVLVLSAQFPGRRLVYRRTAAHTGGDTFVYRLTGSGGYGDTALVRILYALAA